MTTPTPETPACRWSSARSRWETVIRPGVSAEACGHNHAPEAVDISPGFAMEVAPETPAGGLTTAEREAVLGEVVHDLGSEGDTGWFIVGANGYFDVDNACWCEPQKDDAPWTSKHFQLLGTVPDLAAAVVQAGAEDRARIEAEALREALSGITTHNGQPVTPKNLRWAATHEALCRSYIFDVLTGLADALTATEDGHRP